MHERTEGLLSSGRSAREGDLRRPEAHANRAAGEAAGRATRRAHRFFRTARA